MAETRELVEEDGIFMWYKVTRDDGFEYSTRECKPHMCVVHPGDDSCIYCACPDAEIDNSAFILGAGVN